MQSSAAPILPPSHGLASLSSGSAVSVEGAQPHVFCLSSEASTVESAVRGSHATCGAGRTFRPLVPPATALGNEEFTARCKGTCDAIAGVPATVTSTGIFEECDQLACSTTAHFTDEALLDALPSHFFSSAELLTSSHLADLLSHAQESCAAAAPMSMCAERTATSTRALTSSPPPHSPSSAAPSFAPAVPSDAAVLNVSQLASLGVPVRSATSRDADEAEDKEARDTLGSGAMLRLPVHSMQETSSSSAVHQDSQPHFTPAAEHDGERTDTRARTPPPRDPSTAIRPPQLPAEEEARTTLVTPSSVDSAAPCTLATHPLVADNVCADLPASSSRTSFSSPPPPEPAPTSRLGPGMNAATPEGDPAVPVPFDELCRRWMRLLARTAVPHEQPLCIDCWRGACLAPLQQRTRLSLEGMKTLATIISSTPAEKLRFFTMCYTEPAAAPLRGAFANSAGLRRGFDEVENGQAVDSMAAAENLSRALPLISLDAVAANLFGANEEGLLSSLEALSTPHGRCFPPTRGAARALKPLPCSSDAPLELREASHAEYGDDAEQMMAELERLRAQQANLERQLAVLRDVLHSLEFTTHPHSNRGEQFRDTVAAPPSAVTPPGWKELAVAHNIREVQRAFTVSDEAAERQHAMEDLMKSFAYVSSTPIDALCFPIDVSGPIGLIAGLRLGLVPPYSGMHLDGFVQRQLGYAQLLLSGNTSADGDGHSDAVNAACGYMLLLLNYLAHVNGFSFSTAVLRPAGDRSTVALLKRVPVSASGAKDCGGAAAATKSSVFSPFTLSYFTRKGAAFTQARGDAKSARATARSSVAHVVDHEVDFYLTDRLLAWRTFGAACVAVATCVKELADALHESLRCWRVRESMVCRPAPSAAPAAPSGTVKGTEDASDFGTAPAAPADAGSLEGAQARRDGAAACKQPRAPVPLPQLLQNLAGTNDHLISAANALSSSAPHVSAAVLDTAGSLGTTPAVRGNDLRKSASTSSRPQPPQEAQSAQRRSSPAVGGRFPLQPPFRTRGDTVDGFSVRHGSVSEAIWTLGMKKLLANVQWCREATVELERLYAITGEAANDGADEQVSEDDGEVAGQVDTIAGMRREGPDPAPCRQCVSAKPDSFAFASVQSISLYRVSTANVTIPTSASSTPAQAQQQHQSLETIAITDYPLVTLFGHGANAAIAAFSYNDDYMACLTPQNKQVLLWRLKDAETLTAKKITSTALSDAFKREGNPSTMCLAGRHHVLCGTNTGRLISLNTNLDNAEPRSVAIPPSQQRGNAQQPRSPLSPGNAYSVPAVAGPLSSLNPSGTSSAAAAAVESVECIVAATARPEAVACGTSDGTLCLLTLNASTGLLVTASLCPFPAKEKSDTVLDVNPLPVTSLAFEPTSAQYLAVGSQDGALALCDMNKNSIVQIFEVSKLPEKHISSIAWIPGEAGAFYTASTDSPVLRKWSVSSKSVVGSVSIMVMQQMPQQRSSGARGAADASDSADAEHSSSRIGIRSVACIDQTRVVVGLTNGSVKVYDVTQQRLECDIVTGHTDATLSCKLSKHDRDQAATGGVDGMIRVWNLRTLSQQYSIPVGPVMVHSVDWSPNGKHLIAALGSGEVVMYSTSTNRESWRTPVFSELVYRVCWAAGDSSLIAATSRSGVAVLSSKDGKVVRRYPATRGAFYGVDIEPAKSKMIAAGSHDHRIYVYNLSSSSEHPVHVLAGHTDAVCDVAYNPTALNYLLSGSYDGTLRVWDLSSNDAHTISVSSRALKGHADRVRSVAWCSLAPYLVISGSADASIRLWDIRNGVAITTVRGHNADVVAISSHVDRPLTFLSAARDSTLVAWSVALLRQVYLDAALGTLENCIVADPSSLMGVAASSVTVSQVAGAAVQRLAKELAECASRPAERLQKLVSFFESPNGAAEVAEMALCAVDPAAYQVAVAEGKTAATGLVVPARSLAEAARAHATYTNERAHSKSVNAAGPSYRKQRLLEAADELLRVGQLEAHCNVLMEAEEWDRAIAASPAISRAYWRSVCQKAAEAMEAAGDARAVAYYIIGEHAHKAAQLLTRLSQRHYDAATVVCQTCPQQLQRQRAAVLKRYANPQLFAAVLLAYGHHDEAVNVLQHCGDVVLAHLLVHTVPLREQASIDTAFRLSMLQSARQQRWDTALACATRQSNPYDALATVLALFQTAQGKQLAGKSTAPSLTSGNLSTLQGVSERLKTFYEQVRGECGKLQLPLDAAAIQQRHAHDGLASQNQLAAMVLMADPSSGPMTDGAILQSLSGFMESLLTVALKEIDGATTPFYLRQAYNVSAYVSLPFETPSKAGGNASVSLSASAVISSMTPEHKRFLALVFIVAALMAVKVYRFPKLLQSAFTKARELAAASGSASLSTILTNTQGALGTYSPHSKEVDCSSVGCALPALSSEGRQIVSVLTGDPVCGAVHVLEDSSSFISKSEALAWMLCSHFSPLGSGARLTAV
ncbi:WD domain, G-beta repeat family protein [Leishmania donovani]|uniref:WD domain, G-beta repeat family protein n=1 Tax=Leishmania donovani TaxID=5661 RepID=A0A504XJ52_LEIDO|nr:WD domain, G-beta repeat family protein [Leishmania donovani]